MANKKVVAIGGGTGLSNLLRALKSITPNITAVVAMTDNGGSSGRLRQEFGMQPPGDIRNCLSALANSEPDVEHLLAYRFPTGGELGGHNVGNILLAAIMQAEGLDIATATDRLGRILAITGRVLPATCDNVGLAAELTDGTYICGEAEIAADHREIKRLYLQGDGAATNAAALAAIAEADHIFIGPGSVYSSLISNLLLPGFARALYESPAKVYYLANMATEQAELPSDRLSVAYGLIEEYFAERAGVPGRLIDVVVANSGRYSAGALAALAAHGARPIVCDMAGAAVPLVTADLVDEVNLWQHNRHKLAGLLAHLLSDDVADDVADKLEDEL